MKLRHLIPIVIVFGILAMAVVGCRDRNQADTVAQPAANASNPSNKSDGGFSPFVDKAGNISLPKDYKQNWTHLGGWAVTKKSGKKIHEMHDVYTQPETIVAYNKTGNFPDGTVLVKEVRNTQTDELMTGHAAWSTNIKIWFVMIKDRKQRFEDNDHWGDGWGWALFEAKDPTKNVSAGYDSSCISCHTPVEDTDWVYTYGYPGLKQRKQK